MELSVGRPSRRLWLFHPCSFDVLLWRIQKYHETMASPLFLFYFVSILNPQSKLEICGVLIMTLLLAVQVSSETAASRFIRQELKMFPLEFGKE